MNTKELKIEAPEGFEIDKENSTFEKIVFKKKENKLPTKWEDLYQEKNQKKIILLQMKEMMIRFHFKKVVF